MEYNELYDESPYVSREIPRRGGLMTTIRATFLVCATILTSVFALLFYGYQQDQFIINSHGTFVSIFDRKSKSINICDKANCNLITPMFESRPVIAPQNQIIPQVSRTNPPMGHHQMGQHPMGNPQIGSPQMGNPQMGQNPMGGPQMGNPQMMGGNPQMMGQSPMANPQVMGQPQIAGGNPQLMGQINPQMMAQLNPQMMGPQMLSGAPGVQPQLTGGAPAANQAPETEAAADEAADETEGAEPAGTAEANTDAAAGEEAEEEPAPV